MNRLLGLGLGVGVVLTVVAHDDGAWGVDGGVVLGLRDCSVAGVVVVVWRRNQRMMRQGGVLGGTKVGQSGERFALDRTYKAEQERQADEWQTKSTLADPQNNG